MGNAPSDSSPLTHSKLMDVVADLKPTLESLLNSPVAYNVKKKETVMNQVRRFQVSKQPIGLGDVVYEVGIQIIDIMKNKNYVNIISLLNECIYKSYKRDTTKQNINLSEECLEADMRFLEEPVDDIVFFESLYWIEGQNRSPKTIAYSKVETSFQIYYESIMSINSLDGVASEFGPKFKSGYKTLHKIPKLTMDEVFAILEYIYPKNIDPLQRLNEDPLCNEDFSLRRKMHLRKTLLQLQLTYQLSELFIYCCTILQILQQLKRQLFDIDLSVKCSGEILETTFSSEEPISSRVEYSRKSFTTNGLFYRIEYSEDFFIRIPRYPENSTIQILDGTLHVGERLVDFLKQYDVLESICSELMKIGSEFHYLGGFLQEMREIRKIINQVAIRLPRNVFDAQTKVQV